MTNYEKIKSMGVEEMARAICDSRPTCSRCPAVKACTGLFDKYGKNVNEYRGVLEWLESEADEND